MNPLRSYARCLGLHGLRVPTLIGVNSNERAAKQMVVVHVEIDRFDVQEDIHTELESTIVEVCDVSYRWSRTYSTCFNILALP